MLYCCCCLLLLLLFIVVVCCSCLFCCCLLYCYCCVVVFCCCLFQLLVVVVVVGNNYAHTCRYMLDSIAPSLCLLMEHSKHVERWDRHIYPRHTGRNIFTLPTCVFCGRWGSKSGCCVLHRVAMVVLDWVAVIPSHRWSLSTPSQNRLRSAGWRPRRELMVTHWRLIPTVLCSAGGTVSTLSVCLGCINYVIVSAIINTLNWVIKMKWNILSQKDNILLRKIIAKKLLNYLDFYVKCNFSINGQKNYNYHHLCAGEYGKLGHGDTVTQKKPKLIGALVGKVRDPFVNSWYSLVWCCVCADAKRRSLFSGCACGVVWESSQRCRHLGVRVIHMGRWWLWATGWGCCLPLFSLLHMFLSSTA